MVRLAKATDMDQIRQMWQQSFSNSAEFTAFYFNRIFKLEHTVVLDADGEVVASMQVMPYNSKQGETVLKGAYIYAAMTHPAHRRKGYMGKLLTTAFSGLTQYGVSVVFLIPQEEWLFDFYRKFGFSKAFPRTVSSLLIDTEQNSTKKVFLLPSQLELGVNYQRLLKNKSHVILKDSEQANLLLKELQILGGDVFVCSGGIALCVRENNHIVVKEMLTTTIEPKDTTSDLLIEIAKHYGTNEVQVYSYGAEQNDSHTIYYGMYKLLDGGVSFSPSTYMSMMFD